MVGKNTLTEEFYISEIHRFIKEFGKVPTYLEMDKARGYPSGSAYSKNIGWNNALKKANVRIHRGGNGVEKYTKEDIINILNEFEEKEGRVPCYRDMVASNGYHEVSHIKKLFGSFVNAKKEARLSSGKMDDNFFNLGNMNLRKFYILGYIIY